MFCFRCIPKYALQKLKSVQTAWCLYACACGFKCCEGHVARTLGEGAVSALSLHVSRVEIHTGKGKIDGAFRVSEACELGSGSVSGVAGALVHTCPGHGALFVCGAGCLRHVSNFEVRCVERMFRIARGHDKLQARRALRWFPCFASVVSRSMHFRDQKCTKN